MAEVISANIGIAPSASATLPAIMVSIRPEVPLGTQVGCTKQAGFPLKEASDLDLREAANWSGCVMQMRASRGGSAAN